MILIVDDEPWFVGPLTEALADAGFTTQLASTPDECMKALAGGQRIEAVVLDVMLPPGSLDPREVDYGVNTGLVLLRRIRERHPNVPVILHSVRRDFELPEKERVLTLVMSKSETRLEELVQCVQKVVESQRETSG